MVTRTVLIQMSYYRFDNTYMLAAMRRYAGVFSGVAAMDTSSSQLVSEIRNLAGTGVRGFRVQPMGQPVTWLDTQGIAAMWKTCGAEGLAVCPLVDANALPSIDRMCGRFPDTRVVIDHLARIGADGQIRGGDVQQVEGGHTYTGSLELVRDRLPFLSATDKKWILNRTAASVFFHEQ